MFETDLKSVKINGIDYPVKFDLYVLEQVQEQYGDYQKFLNGILRGMPLLSNLIYVLPMIVREGCDIKGIECDLTDKDMVRGIELSPTELSLLIADEVMKCFKVKKKIKKTQKTVAK